MASPADRGVEALRQLKSTEPPLWLSPSVELSQQARAASEHLFSSLQPFCPKSPFDRLLLQGFDAEQIWQQIDLQTQPLVSHLRRELKWFEINPEEISKLFGGDFAKKSAEKEESDGFVEENGTGEGSEGFEDLEDEDEDEEDEEEEEEDKKEEGGGGDGIEDRFLKIKELEEFMEEDEEREYGGGSKRKSGGSKKDDDDDEEDEEDDIEGFSDDGSEDEDINARYEDFFGGKKGKSSKRKQNSLQDESNKLHEDNEENSEDLEEDSDEDDSSRELENGRDLSIKGHKNRVEDLSRDNDKEDNDESGHLEPLSTHEKQLQKLRLKIDQMEKANLEPKSWTMQGEVTAAKRPKNSALEVDLDFEHNVRPAPVITEEVTTSLEDLIKKRILDGHFDDVKRMPGLLSKGPKEMKELDENKSKKGLAEIYEEEFAQKLGLASAPLSFSDELKKEATLLFKTLCLKLDALSHFHFTPKPIIEEMSIQANVPALAMEEIAPMAVSDAAMLAPEEVFAGKGDIKEEAELTQAERKRRRANKKRRFKAERTKHGEKKAQADTVSNGKEES